MLLHGWRRIDEAAKMVSLRDGPVQLGILVEVRAGDRVARARWRHPITAYDIAQDALIHRDGAWWGVDNRPLSFEPIEYRNDL